MLDLGTNNPRAYMVDACSPGEFHDWKFLKEIGRCYVMYKCTRCGAIHRIDSSD